MLNYPARVRTTAFVGWLTEDCAWLHTLARPVQISLRWPDWEQLSAAERQDWLQHGYKDLPHGLWPNFLAWVEWQELPNEAKADAIADEVGALNVVMSKLRFFVRPLDAWFDFKLTMVLLERS